MKYINPTSLLAALIIASSLSFAAPTYSAETLPTFNTGVSDNQWVTIPKGDFFAGQHKKKTPVYPAICPTIPCPKVSLPPSPDSSETGLS